MVQRGVYFFAAEVLDFGDTMNLLLALAFGSSYVAGALLSHRLCAAFGERRVLMTALLAQAALHAGLTAHPTAAAIFAGIMAIGAVNGAKWPVVESFVSAGQGADASARSVGRFNIAWGASVPLALAAAGPVLDAWPRGIFLMPAGLNLVAAALAWPLPPRPLHLPVGHPQRLRGEQLARFAHLLISARWLLMLSYAGMWILAALLPGIMGNLGFNVTWAAGLSGLLDVARLLAFVALGWWTAWHGRVAPLLVAMVALTAGFFAVLLGQSVAAVFVGQALFGLAAGQIYYTALYYAMVVKNASVHAGGGHEGLIGLGFAIGPAAGLLAAAIRPALGSGTLAMLAGVGPLFAVCVVAAVRHARKVATWERA